MPADNFLRQIERVVLGVKSYGLTDGKRDYVGYNRERKVVARAQKERSRGRLAYARDNGFSRENSEPPPDFVDKIVCADAVETLRKLPDNCVDLLHRLTISGSITPNRRRVRVARILRPLVRVFEECVRVLKYGGRIAGNIQPLFSDYVPSHHLIGNGLFAAR